MGVKTKREADGYRVFVNGKPTPLFIEKGDRPRWGGVQNWVGIDTSQDAYLFEAKGLSQAVGTIAHLYSIMKDT